MILGVPTKLESQFRLTYNMILNLLRVEALKIEDMMKKSFSENTNQKLLPEQEKQLQENTKKLDLMDKLQCLVCVPNIYDYYEFSVKYLMLVFELRTRVLTSPVGAKSLSSGRVVVVNNQFYRNVLGVITSGSVSEVQVMILYDAAASTQQLDGLVLPPTRVYLPTLNPVLQCIKIPSTDLLVITSISIREMSENHLVLRDLVGIAGQMNFTGDLKELEFTKIKELDFQEKSREKSILLAALSTFQCNQCTDFVKHYSQVHHEQQLQRQVDELSMIISDQNLELIPDYYQRVSVLRDLKFIEENNTVNLKGRVACEVGFCITKITQDKYSG